MKPRTITLIIFIIGAGLLSYSFTIPYYKDQEAANVLLDDYYDNMDRKEYYIQESELRTNKIVYMDLGAGLLLVSIASFLFLWRGQFGEFSDFKSLKTMNRLMIFMSSNIALLFMIPGAFWYYTFRAMRGDYPPFADSVGIPIYSQTTFILLLFIPLNIFLLLTTLRANLPTKVFVKADYYNRYVIFWELFFGLAILINALALLAFVVDGDHISTLASLFFCYILLSLRASQISRYKNDKAYTL